ncbi:MAG TPA: response regulator [Kofleriaceae bacterium]
MQGDSLQVLVVDDHQDTLDGTMLVLRLDGHRARGASGGMRALEELRTFEPDVMLIDCKLPDMTGYELARRVRSRPTVRRPYLAMVSGYCGAEHAAKSAEAGFDEHVVKPADPTILQAILGRVRAGCY